MNNMRLKPALRYQLEYMLEASVDFFGVIILIIIGLRLLAFFAGVNVGVSIDGVILNNINFNVGVPTVIMVFIVGIAGIREDIKMFLQHGIGRYTTYFSTLLGSLITGVVYGLMFSLIDLIPNYWPAFFVRGSVVPVEGFFMSWFLNIGIFFFTWQLGTVISLIYYRLNRMGQIIFSVAAGGIILFGVPNIVVRHVLRDGFDAFMEAVSNALVNPANLTLFVFLIGVLAAAFNFMLIRRAEVKE